MDILQFLTLMRVGMISRNIPYYDRGGIQTHVWNLSRALVREGVDVDLFIAGRRRESGHKKMDGVRVHMIGSVSLPKMTIGHYLSYSLNTLRYLRKQELDIVHGHSMYSFGFALRKYLPYVVTLHGTQMNEIRAALLWHADLNHVVTDGFSMIMERFSAKKADSVIVVSKENKEDAVLQYQIEQEKIHVIHHGIDLERFSPGFSSEKRILFVGRLHERKGVDRLLEAFSDVIKVMPDTKLRIVGRGEKEKDLRRLAKEKNITQAVEFTGFIEEEDLPRQYKESSLFVLPSRYEGFGIVLLEAMASGLPVLCFETGAAKEIVRDGWNGYIVNEKNLADRIISVIKDRNLMERMGRNAREYVKKNFSWQKAARETIKVYEGLLSATS